MVYPVGCSEIRVDAPMPLVVVNEGGRRATVGAAEDASVVTALGAFVHFLYCLYVYFVLCGNYFLEGILGVVHLNPRRRPG